jgi:hypothetical protein
MTMSDIAALKADFKTKFAAAEKAQRALISAQCKAGLHAPQHFWTWHEVKELLAEERGGWIALWRASSDPSLEPESVYAKFANLAKTQPAVAKLITETLARPIRESAVFWSD